MSDHQKTFRVFLSSSFRDMHAERDYLHHHAFARLDAELIRKGCRLQVMDLRGSTASHYGDETLERGVFRMCLKGMDQYKPRMVSLLGDRYGWVCFNDSTDREKEETIRLERIVHEIAQEHEILETKIKGKSITHLEIIYGSKVMDPDKSFFFVRNLRQTEGMDNEIRNLYFSDRMKQNELKKEIGTLYPQSRLVSYNADWNNTTGMVEGLENLDQMVYDALHRSIFDELFSLERNGTDENSILPNDLLEKGMNRVEHPLLDLLYRFVKDKEKSYQLQIVSGPAGCGKSTLVAQLYHRLEAENVLLLPFFAGEDTKSTSLIHMLEVFCSILQDYLGNKDSANRKKEQLDQDFITQHRPEEDGDDFERLRALFGGLLRKVSARIHVVILLDSADSLERDVRTKYFQWLPGRVPANTCMIVTTKPGAVILNHPAASPELKMFGFVDPIALSIMMKDIAVRDHGKEWDDRVLQKAVDKVLAAGGLPLYAKIITEHLMNMTEEDYNTFKGDDAHIQWMKAQIRELPLEIDNAYRSLLTRARRAYGSDLTDTILGLVATCRHGMDEVLLKKAAKHSLQCDIDDIGFLYIQMFFYGHMRHDIHYELWEFLHQQFRQCLLTDMSESRKKALHSCITDCLDTMPITGAYKRGEYLWHCFQADLHRPAAEYVNTLPLDEWDFTKMLLASLLNNEQEKMTDWLSAVFESAESMDSPDLFYKFFLSRFSIASFSKVRTDLVGSVLSSLHWSISRRMERDHSLENAYLSGWSKSALALFYAASGDRLLALKMFHEAESLLYRIYEDKKDDLEYGILLSTMSNNLGDFYLDGGDRDNSLKWYKTAERLLRQLTESQPPLRRDLAVTCGKLGFYYQNGADRKNALHWYEEAEKILRCPNGTCKDDALDDKRELALACQNLGKFFANVGNRRLALKWYGEAITHYRVVYEADKENPSYISGLAGTCNELGQFYSNRWRRSRSVKWYNEAEQLLRGLYESDPFNTKHAMNLSATCNNLGWHYAFTLDSDRALRWYEEAEKIDRVLFEKNPENPEYVTSLSTVCNNLGIFYFNKGDRVLAEKGLLESERLHRLLYQAHRENPEYISDLALTEDNLGYFYKKGGDLARANQCFEEFDRLRSEFFTITRSDSVMPSFCGKKTGYRH